jgi:glycosyltransferase involved in cell wall biosynthesis
MAAGKPVVAYAGGGALETVVDGQTGVFFHQATSRALETALDRLGAIEIDPWVTRARAMLFDTGIFRARWAELLAEVGLGDLLKTSPDPELMAAAGAVPVA